MGNSKSTLTGSAVWTLLGLEASPELRRVFVAITGSGRLGMVGVYVAATLAFLVIDAIALKFLMYPMFSRHVGDLLRDDVQIGVSLGFYLLYVAGLIYFAVLPGLAEGSIGRAVFNGALLGFLAYGTYEATNMATLRGWSWQMVITDLAWGTVLSATVAAIGWLTGRQVL